MGAASLIAAIGFGATAFMLWVLAALLRDGVRWSDYRVVRVARNTRSREETRRGLSLASDGAHLPEARSNRRGHRVELLENQNHGKSEYDSGLTALDVCSISGKFSWRAVRAKYSGVRWERSL
jgi:hypothetical protein